MRDRRARSDPTTGGPRESSTSTRYAVLPVETQGEWSARRCTLDRRGSHGNTEPAGDGTMNEWWTEIEDDILSGLAGNGAMTPAELGSKIGMSEAATVSVLSMLAHEGRIRVCLVEASPRRSAAVPRVAPSE
jgi:hypothetical protein